MTQSTARNKIRAAMFGIKQRTVIVQCAGEAVEVRQPLVADIVNAETTDDRKGTIVRMMCDYCYVPGTNEKVFEAEDAEALMAVPFGKDWQAINNAINDLSDLGDAIKVEKGNSDATPAA